MKRRTFLCSSAYDTAELGRSIGTRVRQGDCIALHGPLGAGKTVFSQGFAEGLAIEDAITSPTYTLVNEYQGRLCFFHLDLYRIADADEAAMLGLEEMWPRGVMLVEWAERAEGLLPEGHGSITISISDDHVTRRIEISGPEHFFDPALDEGQH